MMYKSREGDIFSLAVETGVGKQSRHVLLLGVDDHGSTLARRAGSELGN